jgi:hypothetical protein
LLSLARRAQLGVATRTFDATLERLLVDLIAHLCVSGAGKSNTLELSRLRLRQRFMASYSSDAIQLNGPGVPKYEALGPMPRARLDVHMRDETAARIARDVSDAMAAAANKLALANRSAASGAHSRRLLSVITRVPQSTARMSIARRTSAFSSGTPLAAAAAAAAAMSRAAGSAAGSDGGGSGDDGGGSGNELARRASDQMENNGANINAAEEKRRALAAAAAAAKMFMKKKRTSTSAGSPSMRAGQVCTPPHSAPAHTPTTGALSSPGEGECEASPRWASARASEWAAVRLSAGAWRGRLLPPRRAASH